MLMLPVYCITLFFHRYLILQCLKYYLSRNQVVAILHGLTQNLEGMVLLFISICLNFTAQGAVALVDIEKLISLNITKFRTFVLLKKKKPRISMKSTSLMFVSFFQSAFDKSDSFIKEDILMVNRFTSIISFIHISEDEIRQSTRSK